MAVLGVLVLVAAALQCSIGFGFALVVTPAMAVLRPELVPAAIVVGTLPGVALGVSAVAVMSTTLLQVAVAVTVLAGVAASLAPVPRLALGSGVLVSSGVVSGFFGATVAVSGPPIALALQDEEPSRLRGTLAATLLLGGLLTLVSLVAVGEFGSEDAGAAAVLLVPVAAGYVVSSYLVPRLGQTLLRRGVLAISTAASGLLLVRAALA